MSKTRSQVLSFITKVSQDKNVDMDGLIKIWNDLNINNTIKEEEARIGKVLEKDTGCIDKMLSGESKGMRCSKKVVDGKERCPAHQKRFEENQGVPNCKETTKKGTPCSRKGAIDGYCTQHYSKKESK